MEHSLDVLARTCDCHCNQEAGVGGQVQERGRGNELAGDGCIVEEEGRNSDVRPLF